MGSARLTVYDTKEADINMNWIFRIDYGGSGKAKVEHWFKTKERDPRSAAFYRDLLANLPIVHQMIVEADVFAEAEWNWIHERITDAVDGHNLHEALEIARTGSDLRDALLMVDPSLSIDENAERLAESVLKLDIALQKP
jgi:hypothetical protein